MYKLKLIFEFPFLVLFILIVGTIAGANAVSELHDYTYLWLQRWDHPESSHLKE